MYAVESRSRHEEYQAYFAFMTNFRQVTAYLDIVHVFSSHDFCSHRLFKVIKACCVDQRTRLFISWCLKSFFARCRMQFDAERQGDSLDRFSHAVFAKWSFLRLQFLQIPLLTVCWNPELRSLASKTKVSSNRSQQRIGKPSSTNLYTFQMWR